MLAKIHGHSFHCTVRNMLLIVLRNAKNTHKSNQRNYSVHRNNSVDNTITILHLFSFVIGVFVLSPTQKDNRNCCFSFVSQPMTEKKGIKPTPVGKHNTQSFAIGHQFESFAKSLSHSLSVSLFWCVHVFMCSCAIFIWCNLSVFRTINRFLILCSVRSLCRTLFNLCAFVHLLFSPL